MKPIELKKHIVRGTCAVKHCTKKCKGQLCSTCRCRKSRIEDPERYAFNNLKNRAKQRGLPFTITLDQFREWCVKVQYIGFKGRSSDSFTIDRKHNDIGYHIDNIQVMTKQANIRKYFSYDYRTKTATVITDTLNKVEDLPFPL
jgi:hypothetical protein